MDQRLSAILGSKPELLDSFPDWMISEEQLDEFRSSENRAVAEISGINSVAAAIKGARDRGLKNILPSVVYTGTEYGDWEAVFENVYMQALSRG